MKRIGFVLGLMLFAAPAIAGDYPPIAYLQDRLPAHPGDPLAKLIPWKGRLLQPYYVRAKAVGNGEYDVRIRLR
jgi:hypothetical protein